MVIKHGRLIEGERKTNIFREKASQIPKRVREKIEWKKMNTRWIKID